MSLPVEGNAASLAGATGWLNSPALEMSGLRGRVVVANFCTYTCINWIRTLPYVRAWEERYRDDGLVMIGVHTPEFSFEHDHRNIETALRQMNVTWPIAIDDDYEVWRAFANHYWPALYFIDAQGRIRHHHFGEGEYESSELALQELLTEAGASRIASGFVAPLEQGAEVQADWANLGSSETYLGSAQATGFASAGGLMPDVRQVYASPETVAPNRWALTGAWTITSEAATSEEPGGRIAYRFAARDVNLVMGPQTPTSTVGFRVTLDGDAPGNAGGVDVRVDGTGSLIEQRMYQLIRQPGPIGDRLFEIEFLDAGAQALCFTFG
jgi:hypothetical protein